MIISYVPNPYSKKVFNFVINKQIKYESNNNNFKSNDDDKYFKPNQYS